MSKQQLEQFEMIGDDRQVFGKADGVRISKTLAVVVKPCEPEGSGVVHALHHIPTGVLISPFAFRELNAAIDAADRFWSTLTTSARRL